MANKKNESPSFTVTDRRLFTEDGELRKDAVVAEEVEPPKPAAVPVPVPARESAAAKPADLTATPADGAAQDPAADDANADHANADHADTDIPPPTAAEQQAQAEAYRQSSKELDSRVELSGRSAKEFEMTFERFLASLYMTAMLQLGMMHEQAGPPRIDIVGARQSIDALALVAEKTKGNLTAVESNFLQNSLYELRMAYVEVTNALSRAPQPGAATGTGGR